MGTNHQFQHHEQHPSLFFLSSPSNPNSTMALLNTLCSSSSPTNPSFLTSQPLKLHDHLPLPLPLPLPLLDLPSHVKQKIIALEIMGINSGRALCLNPSLRDASLDSIHSIISYLQSKGIHFKDLARILGMCPQILTSSIRHDLSPVFAFLSKDLKVPDSNFRRVINKCPRLLTSSVRDQLKPALLYLQRLGFKDLGSLAHQDPVLLVSSVEKTLMPKLEFLVGLGMPREEAVGMVLRCPGLFTFSIERNFKPKYEYFVEEMKGSLEELKEFPQYFTFSLEKRIKARHREVVEKGIKMPLAVMLKSTEEEFRELIEKQR